MSEQESNGRVYDLEEDIKILNVENNKLKLRVAFLERLLKINEIDIISNSNDI